MKHNVPGVLLCTRISLFIFLVCTLWISPAFAQDEISISTGEYAPWTGAKLPHHGFVNHVVQEAFKEVGYRVKFTYAPWKRINIDTKRGKYQASSYWYRNPEREKDFYHSDPVSVEKLVFFHMKTKSMKDWKTLDDLKGYKIGATRGYTYTQEFSEALKNKQLDAEIANTDLQNFKKLLKGRIDIFPATIQTGYNILQKEFDSNVVHTVTFHPHPLSETTGHLLFPKTRKDSVKLLQDFNQGLAKLKSDGKFEQFEDDLLAGKYAN